MSTVAQRTVILWRNFYRSLSLKIVKISTPRKKLIARSGIWNSMILTSLNIVLWPGHIESWPHGAFFISAIFGTVTHGRNSLKIALSVMIQEKCKISKKAQVSIQMFLLHREVEAFERVQANFVSYSTLWEGRGKAI